MSHFYGTVSHKTPNRSGKNGVTKCGHKTTGLVTTCMAWDAGIEVIAEWDEEKKTEVFYIYVNKGSNNKNDCILLTKGTTSDLLRLIEAFNNK